MQHCESEIQYSDQRKLIWSRVSSDSVLQFDAMRIIDLTSILNSFSLQNSSLVFSPLSSTTKPSSLVIFQLPIQHFLCQLSHRQIWMVWRAIQQQNLYLRFSYDNLNEDYRRVLFSSKADSVLSLTAMRKPKYCAESWRLLRLSICL